MALKEIRPYPPSWLDRLIDFIESLPGPAWLYYLAGLVLVALISMLLEWAAGIRPAGLVSAQPFLYAVYPVYAVGLMHYLRGQARMALFWFRPALDASDAEYTRLEYTLLTVPARSAWIVTALAGVVSIADAVNRYRDPLTPPGEKQVFVLMFISFFTLITVAAILLLAYHTFRQLRMVGRIQATAPAINLFDEGPVYAFSQLTARTGLGLLFFAYFSFLRDPPDPAQPFTYVLPGAVVLTAVAAFILPLLGMHDRLVLEKRRLESEINHGVEVTYHELRRRVQSKDYADADDLNKTISSLLSLRDVVAKLSTWPWRAEAVRTFVSALLLPIVIWIITRILDRLAVFGGVGS